MSSRVMKRLSLVNYFAFKFEYKQHRHISILLHCNVVSAKSIINSNCWDLVKRCERDRHVYIELTVERGQEMKTERAK